MNHTRAVAFDFDGTLIQGGIDKGVHIMVASWIACRENGFEAWLHPAGLERDIERMIRAYIRYPGAPRFQQLAAIVNCLVNDKPAAFEDPGELGVPPAVQARYDAVRQRYNTYYSTLNNAAAERHWRPFPSVKTVLAELARHVDLYIASGVTEDILQEDIDRHGFDRALFRGIRGGNVKGGDDKGQILRKIRERGYTEVLFVADSNKDLEYALAAEVKFFRIRRDADFARLLRTVDGDFPHEPDFWDYEPEELEFFRVKTLQPLQRYIAGKTMTPEETTDWIIRGV